MNQILEQIIPEKQAILYKICKILSYGGKKTTAQITYALESQGTFLDKDSNVLYKYLKKLIDMELIEEVKDKEKVNIKVKHYALKREYHVISPPKISQVNTPFLVSLQKTLNKYKNLPINNFIEDLVKKSSITIDDNDFMVIDFETPDSYQGNENLDFFYHKIADCETAKFKYKKFEWDAAKEIVIKPYLLKEHNKRWYLIGKSGNEEDYRTYSLDRVECVDIHFEENFERDLSFDPYNRWEHSIGIFTGEPSEVSFELKETKKMKNIDFLKTSKIHKSQKEYMIDDHWLRVELKVLISYELVREIRKLGIHNLRKIEPNELDVMIREY